MTIKLHVLNMITYGDFDSEHATPIAVSANVERLHMLAAENNACRTNEEIARELHYEVGPHKVEYLDV